MVNIVNCVALNIVKVSLSIENIVNALNIVEVSWQVFTFDIVNIVNCVALNIVKVRLDIVNIVKIVKVSWQVQPRGVSSAAQCRSGVEKQKRI